MKFLLLILTQLSVFSFAQFNKETIYEALSSEDEGQINREIEKLKKIDHSSEIKAFKGALIAKKASFQKEPKAKIDLFKSGVNLLEEAIEKKPNNVEFRFLRLSVQEHSPKIMRYKGELSKDKEMILKNFNHLDPDLKAIIRDYAKESDVLPSDKLD